MSRDALVVGVNTYKHLPGLQAPAQDAESVARCLESFGECRVVRLPEVITQQKPAIAARGMVTTALLEAALIKLFKPAGKTVPQTAIFYYSGHGLQRQAGIQEGYLATSDANPAAGQYGLSLHWLRRLLQESPVRQRVILLDCCHSGEFFSMLEADPGARSGTDRLFMAASREYEAAYESLDSAHSVFTQALLSGLNPYKIKGGIVNGHSLTDTVNRQLKGELQQPLFESSGGEIVLTRLPGLATPGQPPPPLVDRLQKLRYGFCPFVGDEPFDIGHRQLFFGRDEVTQQLVQQVQASRLCALVGASGSGKTSLLKAGLMAHLASAAPAWQSRYAALGASPVQSVAAAFVDAQANGLERAAQLRQAETFLRQGPEGLCQLVQAVAGDSPLVLILDQFETLLAPAATPEEDDDRRRLLAGLTAALQQECGPLHLVLGLRSHHLPALAEFPVLQALVAQHLLPLPTMSYNQLKATIVGPLDQVGLRYDANLVYTLLLDVVGAPADLALLQTALKALWSRRETGPNGLDAPRLTLAAYAEMGGIRQLLNQRADGVYRDLAPAEQAIAQRIFLGLCDLGDGAAPNRRQLSLPELITEAMPQAAVVATLEKLMAARLVVAQADGTPADLGSVAVPAWCPTGDRSSTLPGPAAPATLPDLGAPPHFDIGHEALLRNWPQMQTWLDTQGPVVQQQRALEVAAHTWHQQGQPRHLDYFLTTTRLRQAHLFQQAHPHQLSVQATQYLAACDRHCRRSRRQRYLVRLLIPVSMVTGMAAAYGHSYWVGAGRTLSASPTPVVNSTVGGTVDSTVDGTAVPTFELVSPAPAANPSQGAEGSHPLGSPQAGMVGTGVFNRARLGERGGTTPHQVAAPPLRTALERSMAGLAPLEAQAQTTGSPLPEAPTALPPANQVVSLESWWVSPSDPGMIIQIWCTQAQPEPVCFTSTAARRP